MQKILPPPHWEDRPLFVTFLDEDGWEVEGGWHLPQGPECPKVSFLFPPSVRHGPQDKGAKLFNPLGSRTPRSLYPCTAMLPSTCRGHRSPTRTPRGATVALDVMSTPLTCLSDGWAGVGSLGHGQHLSYGALTLNHTFYLDLCGYLKIRTILPVCFLRRNTCH